MKKEGFLICKIVNKPRIFYTPGEASCPIVGFIRGIRGIFLERYEVFIAWRELG